MKLFRSITSSLRAKLLTMFIILTCMPLITVGLISYQKSYHTVFNTSKSQTMLLAEQLARDIDSLFTDTRKLLELEKNPQVLQYLFSQNDTYENAKDILRTMDSYRQTYQYDSVLNVTMINMYGRGISERKGVFQVSIPLISGEPFKELLQNKETVMNIPSSDPKALPPLDGSDYQGRSVISILSTIKQRVTHEVIGYIIIDLDDSIVRRFCDTNTIGKNGFFYVADESGAPILIPTRLNGTEIKWPRHETLSLILRGPDKHIVDKSEGKPKFIFASPSKTTGWSIVGLVPLQEIVWEAQSIRQLIVVSVVLSIIFALTLHYILTKRLTLPLHILKKKMQLAASGFLEAKVMPVGNDEITDLGNSFNTMIDKIRMLLDQCVQEQHELKKAELRALQAQINPHFLYNTLDSILWLAEAGKKEQVVQVVLALSRFFRIGLSKGRDWITIEKEVEHLQSYLIIQQTRYRDILDYEICVDPGIHPLPILKMILQPIVENALYHGLKNKRGKGRIRISGHTAGNKDILFRVEDNGIGISEARLHKLLEELQNMQIPESTGQEVSGGFGLHNVHQRLRLFYGESYGVQVESVESEGTTVTLRIPMR
ncbi:histidine kinase [Gorillibacterium sp. sgz5001074]|uniref:cache domain-containing sensor histidine kinase n=1 Tax=Gorillibacterium sp. sgz5001074 TaxID=3446695 RepID=UPI003F6655C2